MWRAWAWPTPRTLCWLDCFVAAAAAAAVLRLPWILSLSEITLPVPVPGKKEQSIEQFFPCWKKYISSCITCASLMSCQSCQLMGQSCSNPVHVDHQYPRKDVHAGVSQWPLWENHSLPRFHPRQRSDQWIVSPSQCWKPKKLGFPSTSTRVWRRFLGCWCCCVTASRNPVATRNHVAVPFKQGWAEHYTTFAVLEEQALVLVQCLASLANWWGIPAVQFMPIASTEERAQMQVSDSDHCERTILFPDQRRVSPSQCWKPKKLGFPGISTLVWRRFLGC